MNCSRCGKPINERKSYISSLGNDHKTEVSIQHIKCFNAQFLDEKEEQNED